MSTWLLSLLASFILLTAMGILVWWHQHRLAKRRGGPIASPCGCARVATELVRPHRKPPSP